MLCCSWTFYFQKGGRGRGPPASGKLSCFIEGSGV